MSASYASSYVPGGQVALAGPTGWLLVDLPPDHAEVQASWRLLDAGGTATRVLDRLLGVDGPGLPSFAMVTVEGGRTRVVVGGAATASVVVAGETVECRGEPGVIWTERVILGEPSTVQLTGADPPSGPHLPLRMGVVAASVLTVERTAARADTSVPRGDDHGDAAPSPSEDGRTGARGDRPAEARHPAEARPVPAVSPPTATWEAEPPSEFPETYSDPAGSSDAGRPVLALTCPDGHQTPSNLSRCRVCGAAVEGEPVEVVRPALGVLTLSSGDEVVLDRAVLFGRAPQPKAGVAAEETPTIVRLSWSEEVSRTHLRVTLDGWDVLVRDLGSSNGTVLTLPDGSSETLRAHEDYRLEPGSKVILAEESWFVWTLPA